MFEMRKRENCKKDFYPENCVFVAAFGAAGSFSAFSRVQRHNSPCLKRCLVSMQLDHIGHSKILCEYFPFLEYATASIAHSLRFSPLQNFDNGWSPWILIYQGYLILSQKQFKPNLKKFLPGSFDASFAFSLLSFDFGGGFSPSLQLLAPVFRPCL